MIRKPKVHIRAPNVDDPLVHSPLTRKIIEFANSPECEKAMNNIPVPKPKIYDERAELVGQAVTVYRCHAREHGNNEGCLCDLIGQKIEISGIYKTPYVGTPSYHIKGSTKRIQEREFVPNEQKYGDGELERVRKVLGHDYIELEE